ncbi:PilC/PilY family type IV pilus protein [Methylovulum miyakonense]|uniref:PilC/PilY family type IV pilus protein n=1 Tax=Methylovulum miyakonense TaxID=645578 RepID=UPI003BB6E0F6
MNAFNKITYPAPNTWLIRLALGLMIGLSAKAGHAAIATSPLFLTTSVPPIVMLVMGRDHKLYYEAYNDASDLDGDGLVDVGYKPGIDYYGYFDSHRCYDYSGGLFVPQDVTIDKKCSGVNGAWSGDFLNYVTTSRIDALRKVLYGGYRSVDTTTETVIKRAFIPQDAHSWGKEYNPGNNPGYLISDYTPLSEPITGTRHIFANVSLAYGGQPLLRILNDTQYRVWEWLSIERPVAGSDCDNGSRATCAEPGTTTWSVVPSDVLSNLTRTTYSLLDKKGSKGTNGDHPGNHADFDSWITKYAVSGRKYGSGPMSTINGNDSNPYGSHDYYMTVVKGTITVPTSGTYKFSVDGDDAVEVIIGGTVVAGWYDGHGACNCDSHSGTKYLTANTPYNIEFRHEEQDGGDSFVLRWGNTLPDSDIVDYELNVKVCVAADKLEANCKAYNDGATTTYKPTGLLHTYGENDAMAFGLITGSYKRNISGGVLRKNIESFKNEVDPDTGIFTNINGIVKTINSLRVVTFKYDCPYCYASGWITTRPINEGEAAEWGNPIAEMMYEGLRYFAGKATPTGDFKIGPADTPDATLGLPVESWLDPYKPVASGGGGHLSCAKPMELVISDVNASYDTDQLPGSYFSSFTGDLAGLNVSALADTIWAGESEADHVFIGQSGAVSDGTPSPKPASSFKDLRGLAPEEPTKLGGFYAGSVALHGAQTDLNDETSDQKTDTIAVALASPLPRIEIPVNDKIITLVPFAKSVNGAGINSVGSFQPTDQIVDFYVEKIVNTAPGNMDGTINNGRAYGKFRINFEDVEQSADHDMDAIVEYTFTVNESNQVVIALNSTYAAGGITQHMGYVISGTTADGIYLEVLDQRDGDVANDVDYFLDTPPGQSPGGNWSDGEPLPFSTSRTFTAGSSSSASFIKHDPLWYAAKWGITDKNDDGVVNEKDWDSDNDSTPDNYFLVTNAGKLPEQLGKAFAKALNIVSSASAVAANSTRLDTGSKIYQARFNSTDWSGQLVSFSVNTTTGALSPDWDASELLPVPGSRNILTSDPTAAAGSRGIPFQWANLGGAQQNYLDTLLGYNDGNGELRVGWLRGDNSNEKKKPGGIFRDRTNFLGDIVNSDPVYVGGQDYEYSALPGSEGSQYPAFVTHKKSHPMLYVGANDGMLHGFDANTVANGGKEVLAYIPNALFPELSKLTSPSYTHQYYVDGTSGVGDVYFGSAWHALLAGTTGAGGRAVFALDVTNPEAFGPTSVLWEFSNADDPDLGYTLAQPAVARTQDGHWVVIVANGYNSDNGHAVLFVLDAETGVVLQKIDTGAGTAANKNGLSSPIAVDTNNDHSVDTVYAGDLYGNLWKFNLSGNAGSWPVPSSPFFVACTTTGSTCSTANRQPITGKPNVGQAGGTGTDQNGVGRMVYFGTGKYFETTDNIIGADPQVQTFYGLWDQGSAITDRSLLQEQTITHEGIFGTSNPIRIVSKTPVCYGHDPISCSLNPALKSGWALNLTSPVKGAEGERVVSFPLLRRGLVVFATVIPSADPCESGGTSWLMEIDAINGGEFSGAPFDANGDGKVDAEDKVTVDGVDHFAAGIDLEVGIIKTPAVVEAKTVDYKYVSGSTGAIGMAVDFGDDDDDDDGGGGGKNGRRSWQQLK